MRFYRCRTASVLSCIFLLNFASGASIAEAYRAPDCSDQAVADSTAKVKEVLNQGESSIVEEIRQANTISALGACIDNPAVTGFLMSIWDMDEGNLKGIEIENARTDNVRVSVARELLKAHNQNGYRIDRNEVRVFLHKLTVSGDGRTKSAAIFAMAELHDRESAEFLQDLVLASPYQVAQTALKALYWNCGPTTDEIINGLDNYLTDERLIAIKMDYEREPGAYLRNTHCPAMMGYPSEQVKRQRGSMPTVGSDRHGKALRSAGEETRVSSTVRWSAFFEIEWLLLLFFCVISMPMGAIAYALSIRKGRSRILWTFLGFVPYVGFFSTLYLSSLTERYVTDRLNSLENQSNPAARQDRMDAPRDG